MPIGSSASTMFRMDIRADDVNSDMQHGRCSNDTIPQQNPLYYKHLARFRPVCCDWSGANIREITEYSQTDIRPPQPSEVGIRRIESFPSKSCFPRGFPTWISPGAISDSEKRCRRSDSHRGGIGCCESQNQKRKSEESLVKIESARRIH